MEKLDRVKEIIEVAQQDVEYIRDGNMGTISEKMVFAAISSIEQGVVTPWLAYWGNDSPEYSLQMELDETVWDYCGKQ